MNLRFLSTNLWVNLSSFCHLRSSGVAIVPLDILDVLALKSLGNVSSGSVSFLASPSEFYEYDSNNEMLFVSVVTTRDPPHSIFSLSQLSHTNFPLPDLRPSVTAFL